MTHALSCAHVLPRVLLNCPTPDSAGRCRHAIENIIHVFFHFSSSIIAQYSIPNANLLVSYLPSILLSPNDPLAPYQSLINLSPKFNSSISSATLRIRFSKNSLVLSLLLSFNLFFFICDRYVQWQTHRIITPPLGL